MRLVQEASYVIPAEAPPSGNGVPFSSSIFFCLSSTTLVIGLSNHVLPSWWPL
jgi:hypothetical protein